MPAAPPPAGPARRRRRAIVRVLFVAGAAALLWVVGGWAAVQLAMAPARRAIEPMAILDGRRVVDVQTTAADGTILRGWSVAASPDRVVIVFAGYGGDRRSNLGIARCYLSRGWSVLLPDLRATGASGGDRVGFGYLERGDVAAWSSFARGRGARELGLHGQSLGAAAIAYCVREHDLDPAFVVFDSCYDDIRNALANRLPWLPWPALTMWPVVWFGAAALATPLASLRPVDCISQLRCPVLFVAGDADTRVLPAETMRLFAACRSERRLLRWMPGGRHQDLWLRFPARYAAAIDELLE